MYRTAAKRLFLGASAGGNRTPRGLFHSDSVRCFSSSADSQPFANQNANPYQHQHQHHHHQRQNPGSPDSASSSPSSSDWSASEEARRRRGQGARADCEDEQARVLRASLFHVLKLGWTESAMIAGARDTGVSPAIVGSFPRKEAALVEYFMDECLQRLIDRIDSGEDLKNLIPSERISKLVRIRLEMQAPYISNWPQALSIQALPMNVLTSLKQRAMLVDEIWHAAGDEASDTDWYVKRTVLGGIYSTTEIYMLTDRSTDFRNTWTFLDARVKDAFDLKKTIQEAKYLAEAVGAGMGGSLEGFVKRVFKG